MPTEFTPAASLFGGALIGLAAVLLLLFNGRIAGVSGILASLFPPLANRDFWARLAFIGGLLAAPLAYLALAGSPVHQTVPDNWLLVAPAGLLAGFGAVHGGGCTSGHGVCGLSRLSARSFAATLVFMATAFATVFVLRHLVVI